MSTLPFDEPGARIAFDVVVGAFVLSRADDSAAERAQPGRVAPGANEHWAALPVAFLVPTAGLIYRIRFEELALLESLGEPYRRFAEGRQRVFPGIW